MEFNYVFKEEDFEFYKQVTLNSIQKKVKNENIYHIILILLYLSISIAGFYRLGVNAFIFHFITFTLVIAFLFFITTGNRKLFKLYQNASYTEQENQEMYIKVNEEGIYLRDFEGLESIMLFDEVIRINKSNSYLVLYSKKHNLIIPLRIFQTSIEYNDFIEYIKSHLSNKIEMIENEK